MQRAHEQGVNVLALCDHDTVMGIDEAKIEADKLGIELINGVEISTNWEGRGIHIVGLNFDKTHPKMTALLAEQKSLREKRAVEIGHKLEKAGVLMPMKAQSVSKRGSNSCALCALFGTNWKGFK